MSFITLISLSLLIDKGELYFNSIKFSNLTEPYIGYHNLNFYKEFGPGAFLSRARAEGLRDFGAALSPQNAFYIMLGVETIGPRMMKHVSNAEYIVSFLSEKDEVYLG